MSKQEEKNIRKCRYRHRVKCEKCNKEMDSDYKQTHIVKMHEGEQVKFTIVLDSHQTQLSGFIVSNEKQRKINEVCIEFSSKSFHDEFTSSTTGLEMTPEEVW